MWVFRIFGYTSLLQKKLVFAFRISTSRTETTVIKILNEKLANMHFAKHFEVKYSKRSLRKGLGVIMILFIAEKPYLCVVKVMKRLLCFLKMPFSQAKSDA